MKRHIFFVLIVAVAAQVCFAEVYEYTDSNGVTHFTDDPSKVPQKIRTKKARESSLTQEESKVVDVLIKLDKNKQDFPVKNEELPEFKKNVRKFGENFKDELGDPAEPIDTRLSTPEGALSLFRQGLRSGNLSVIKASLTGKAWDDGDGYKQLTKAQMLEMEKILSILTVVHKQQDKNIAVFDTKSRETGEDGTIEFVNFYGNWKIQKF